VSLYDKTERRHISAIEKRVAHLRTRVRGRTVGTSFDVKELGALEWALVQIAKARGPQHPDFDVVNRGGLYELLGLSSGGRDWIAENTRLEDWQRTERGGILFDSPRLLGDVVDAMKAAGLTLNVRSR